MSIFNYISKGTIARIIVSFVNAFIASIFYHRIMFLDLSFEKKRMFLTLGFLIYILVTVVTFMAISKRWPK